MSHPPPAAVAIIPVRLGSRRLPGKALLDETGTPLFLHTFERARAAAAFAAVLVATDSPDVAAAAAAAGAACVLTSDRPRTGSERCAEVLAGLDDDVGYVVDVQGDWPEIAPHDLDRLVQSLRAGAPIATLAARLADPDKVEDPNVVKVVRAQSGDALYFSRAPVPFDRGDPPSPRLRHIGVYGFDRATLARIPGLPSSGLDELEGLEQLRFLDNGIPIRVLDATTEPWGIETRADYDAFVRRAATWTHERSGERPGEKPR